MRSKGKPQIGALFCGKRSIETTTAGMTPALQFQMPGLVDIRGLAQRSGYGVDIHLGSCVHILHPTDSHLLLDKFLELLGNKTFQKPPDLLPIPPAQCPDV